MQRPDAAALVEVAGPLDLARTLAPLTDGGGDPTWRLGRSRGGDRAAHAHALWTPEGPATVLLEHEHGSAVAARGWGPGATWALAAVPGLIGAADERSGFRPELHPAVVTADRRLAGLRVGRVPTVWEVLVPVVLGQRVTTGEARRSWQALVRRLGRQAPGPPLGVRLPPPPEVVAALGDADWHLLGVERARADAVRGLIRLLPALQRAAKGADVGRLRAVAESARRVGPWTSTYLAGCLTGDPDVVLLGDLHLPGVVGHVLAGEVGTDDARMLELLEPFRPHRGRVVRLLKAGRSGPPRHAPRYTPLPLREM